MKRNASAVWTGGLKDGRGIITSDSGVLSDTQYSFGTRFENGKGTNPEELIASAHAGCFSMALSAQLGTMGLTPERIATTASVSLDKVGDGFEITAVHLTVKAKVPGADAPQFQTAANNAKAGCPVSKVLNATITMEATLEGVNATVTPIDLRSDTVTRPTAAMRAAMAEAPVGDDQFGEDPTVNRLQERVAALLGKEAALWVPSGTMANQVALRVLTRPGDTVLVSRESHAVWSETGGGGANAGVQFTEIGGGGAFTVADLLAARVPPGHVITPPTTLVEIENTHNRSGGVVFPQHEAVQVCAEARRNGMVSYLDGARLWNAAEASGLAASALAEPFDLVSVAFSKGLGAPGGLVLAGSRPVIGSATRHRRMLGGAMRQVGVFAAAALHALDHHLGQLAVDHVNASLLARRLAASPRIVLDLATVQTNIVVFRLGDGAPDAATVVARARARNVLLFAFGPRTLRTVTHLDVTRDQCEEAGQVLAEIAETP